MHFINTVLTIPCDFQQKCLYIEILFHTCMVDYARYQVRYAYITWDTYSP